MKKTSHFRQWKYLVVTSKHPSKGFTMLEVLAALMISFTFLMGTLNAMLITALMQVKAERQSQASYWIQQDLENLRSVASSQATDATKCTSSFSTSYAGALNTTIASTINGTLGTSATSGTNPVVTTTTATKSLFNKTYTMTRVTGGSDTNPQILTITYTVSNSSDLSSLATLYTEVIPAPALNCSS